MASESAVVSSQTSALSILSASFLAVTTIFFACRIIQRLHHRQREWDDLMATCAYITLVIQSSFGFMAVREGFGKHKADIPNSYTQALEWFWLYQICYKILGCFTKLTFCFLYLRVFPLKIFRRIVLATTAIIALGSLAFVIATLLQCWPIRKNWDRKVSGSCVNFLAFWISHASFNTLMDIVVYLLPLPVIRNLQTNKRTKAGLIALFSLGVITIAASIARATELPDSAKSAHDPTWGSAKALMWTEIEANTAVTCCCLPPLQSAAKKFWHRLRGKASLEQPSPDSESSAGVADKLQSKPKRSFAGFRPESSHSSRILGLFTDARYSLPLTAQCSKTEVAQNRWYHKVLPAWLCSRARSGQNHQLPYLTDHPSRLRLGGLGIYKATNVQVQTDRKSSSLSRTSAEPSLKVLECRWPATQWKTEVSGGETLTLQEILSEAANGPIVPQRTAQRP